MEQFQKHYQVERTIGRGCFAEVIQAKNRHTGEDFAVKLVKKTHNNIINIKEELRAFRLLQRNPHPNIVKCIELYEDRLHVFMVMEYLPNGDMMSLLESNPPSEKQIKKYFYCLLHALRHLHRLGICHRDVKLENICLSQDGTGIKLIDFNLSSEWSPCRRRHDYCGSLYYCAPELFLRRPYLGPEIDVWSAAVVLFCLLFRRFPFDISTDEAEEFNECEENGSQAELAQDTEEGKHQTKGRITSAERNRRIALKVVKLDFSCHQTHIKFESTCQVVNLFKRIFVFDPSDRLTLEQLLAHRWLEEVAEKDEKIVFCGIESAEHEMIKEFDLRVEDKQHAGRDRRKRPSRHSTLCDEERYWSPLRAVNLIDV